MEKIQFKRAELEDKEMISEYLNHHTSRSCERTFVNVYLWSRQYPVKWAVIEDVLVFKSENEEHLSFAYPAGEPDKVKKVLEILMEYSKEHGCPYSMYKNGIRGASRLNITEIWQITSMKPRSLLRCLGKSFMESEIISTSSRLIMRGVGFMKA